MKTIFPDGPVPADFQSWINHVAKQRIEIQLKLLKGEFDWINERNPINRHILSQPVVWVESFHVRKTPTKCLN